MGMWNISGTLSRYRACTYAKYMQTQFKRIGLAYVYALHMAM